MTKEEFKIAVAEGIPAVLPQPRPYDNTVSHAPRRKDILSPQEKKLALRNALRYFPEDMHPELAPEFARELQDYGRIYMYRFRPHYEMKARSIEDYPARSRQAAAIMMMIQNNLDPAVAQHPHELITYGGNGAVFQNWAQYRLAMKYLSEMTDSQTLVMYSGHPLGLFPSHPGAPRVVVTNGMVIPNYSKPDDWERMNAMGVSQYGQMTAGSYMYIGPQGIVHGTTITVLNAARAHMEPGQDSAAGMLFVSAGLGGMSGAQPKAGNISGVVSVVAEINPAATQKRHAQGWVDEVHEEVAGADCGCSGTGCIFVERTVAEVRCLVFGVHFLRQSLILSTAANREILALGGECGGFVAIGRHSELVSHPLGKFTSKCGTFFKRNAAYRYKWTNIGGAHARMCSVMLPHVNEFSGFLYTLESGLHNSVGLSDKSHYRAVCGLARINIQ